MIVLIFKEISLWSEVSSPPRFQIQGGVSWALHAGGEGRTKILVYNIGWEDLEGAVGAGRRVSFFGGKCDTCGQRVALTDRLGGHRMTPSGPRRRCTYEPQVSHLAVQLSAGPSGQEASAGRCPTCGHVSRSWISQWEHLQDRGEKCDPPQLELIRLFRRPAGMHEKLQYLGANCSTQF